jgi:hypothetical protein
MQGISLLRGLHMNVRALFLFALIGTSVFVQEQTDAQNPPVPPNIPQQPAATLPSASTPESGSRSNTTSPLSTPATNAPRGEPIPIPPVPMAPTRADDSYAIYSLLMPGSYLLNLGPANNQTWLVADATITRGQPGDRVPSARRCIQPPADRRQDFQAVFDDFDKHKSESIQLERNFQVQIPYQLVNEEQRKSFADTRTANAPAPDASTTDEFRGTPGITYFSQVYFNIDNTLALVYMQEFCGPKCGEGEWVALEKVTGGWVRRNWNVCTLAN